MAEFAFGVSVSFGTQTAAGEANYNDALDAVTTTLETTETPGADTEAAGLVLGYSGAGIGESGLTFGLGRDFSDKAVIGTSFTKPLSDFLKATVPTFTFAFPFCGSRADTPTPADAELIPIPGVAALLEMVGMEGTAWGGGVGQIWEFSSNTNPISALIYYFGNRIELADCRGSLSIDYTPGQIPIATATIQVGSIKDHSAAAFPTTLNYDEQATVSAPVIESVGHAWQDTRGFQGLTLEIDPAVEDVLDSNSADGVRKESTGRTTTISGTMFADDTADKIYDYTQLIATAAGSLDQLSFQVGADATAGNPALAHQIVVPTPELIESNIQKLGQNAGTEVELLARNAVANKELQIIFR